MNSSDQFKPRNFRQIAINIIINKPGLLTFIIFSIVLIINNLFQKDFNYYYDSGQYWSAGDLFIEEEKFSLMNYDLPVRGYVFPLIIHFIKQAATQIGISGNYLFVIFMSIIYSACLTLLVPTLIRKVWKINIGFINILVFSFSTLYFHWSLFFYPLSDLLSAAFLIAGVVAILKLPDRTWGLFPAGIFLSCASLVRPSYQIAIPFLTIWAILYYRNLKKTKFLCVLVKLIWLLAGIIFVYSPQIAINKSQHNILSPFVQTQITYGEDLFMKQLVWGLEIQKYETNVGTTYPTPQVYFIDEQGKDILVDSGLIQSTTNYVDPNLSLSLPAYINLFLKYPLDFISIYARHLFNGLDIVYNSVYVKNIYDKGIVLRLGNYTIWFLVIKYLLKYFKLNNVQPLNFTLPLIIALPAILSIPTAMEVRFMLPIHLIAYAVVAFWVIPDILKTNSTHFLEAVSRNAIPYLAFLVLCFMISSTTYTELQFGPYLLGGN